MSLSLREMRRMHPDHFHPTQDWFVDEEFMDLTPRRLPLPAYLTRTGMTEPQATAADLAALYLADPTLPMWTRYLWTCDHDRHGQRVYVGDNGRGLEIHRHLHLTDRWSIPVWP